MTSDEAAAAPAANMRVNPDRLWDTLMEMAKIGPGVAGGNNRQTLTDADAEGRRLAHDPRKRECRLASVTSLTLLDGRVVAVDYAEPAAELYAGPPPTTFAAGA